MNSDQPWLPWKTFPSLREARLRTIAEIIRDVRSECARTHEPSKGDDSWVLGCRAFRRTCFAVVEAAKEYEWLSVVESPKKARIREFDPEAPLQPEMHFVFAIGPVPLRFYRGSADRASTNSLKQQEPEQEQRQLALDLGEGFEQPTMLRLAVETDALGLSVMAVVLVEVDERGNVHRQYRIRLEGARIREFRPATDEGRDLGEPELPPRRDGKRRRDKPA